VQKTIYVQLSALTFFQFVVVGSLSPMIGTYLKDTLGLPGSEVGIILTVYQLASMAAPLITAFVVDRLVSARDLYVGLNLAAAGLSLGLASVTGFTGFLGLYAAYAFLMGPTGGLVNALSFAQMPDRSGQYGLVRLWGTVGWIAAAAVLAGLWLLPGSSRSWMFWLGAGGNLVAAAGALTLPRKKPGARGAFRLFPREAFQVFLRPGILKIGAVVFASVMLDRFYFIATAPYLKQLGFTDSQLMPAMTLGQVTEVLLLLFTGPALKRWGLRNTLLLGLAVQFLRFALMVWNPGAGWLILALSLNGFVFAFFYAVVTIYVDGHTDTATRGGVHQLMGLIFLGSSSVIGSLLAGLAFGWFDVGGQVDYRAYWSLPWGLSVVAIVLVLLFFRKTDRAVEDEGS